MKANAGNILLIQIERPEIRVAELRDGGVFDLDIDRAGRVLGDIYKGRVENVLPGMDGAFIDIGLKRNALIYVGDVETTGQAGAAKQATITQLLQPNEEIIVQIARPPIGSKGARVTTKLSLPGRYAILLTNTDSVGVSKRIESDKERQRLRKLAARLRSMGHGLILRTEAEGVSEDDLERDIRFLTTQLEAVYERAGRMTAPALLHRESGLLERVARDKLNDQINAIWIDSSEEFETFCDLARLLAPQLLPRIHFYDDALSLFSKFGVEKIITEATQRLVELPNGGSIVVDETEALIAIDVNTGRFVGKNQLSETVLQTNLQAVDEIARQLRIRNLGGVIVIDFIDMPRTRDRIRVLNALEAALKHDRIRTKIVNISPSGLVEMTRRREGYSLRQLLRESCSYCEGDGMVERASTVAINTRRRIRALARQYSAGQVVARLHPEAACALLGPNADYVQDLEDSAQVEVFVRVDETMHPQSSEVVAGMESNAEQIMVGQRWYLREPHLLYPRQSPHFIVARERLIKLTNLNGNSGSSDRLQTCFIELTAEHRWFLEARLIVQDTAVEAESTP